MSQIQAVLDHSGVDGSIPIKAKPYTKQTRDRRVIEPVLGRIVIRAVRIPDKISAYSSNCLDTTKVVLKE